MRFPRFLLFAAACASLSTAALAQSIPVSVKSQPNAPIQVTAAECSAISGKGERCRATVRVSPTGNWTAYGLKWTLTYADGRQLSSWSVADSLMRPDGKAGEMAPNSIREAPAAGGFELRDSAANPVQLSSAAVEVEFVVNADRRQDWGNTRSVFFHRLMAFREGYKQGRRNAGLEFPRPEPQTDPRR
jgi:hypothetical protein